jgi:hypothetical protein
VFGKFIKDDLVAYKRHPKSLPLGIVKEVKESKGKAVVLLYLLDTNLEDEIFSLKCVPYHELELVARAQCIKRSGTNNEHIKKEERKSAR